MTQKEILDHAIIELKDIRRKVTDEFYYQEEKSLQHKPTPEKWSAIQCFDHINMVSAYYLDVLRKVLENSKDDKKAADKKYTSGLIGAYMIKSMAPKGGVITNQMKTFSGVRPLSEREEGAIVKGSKVFADFFADLDEFERLINEFRAYNIQKIKVPSLLGNILKFKIGDCFPFLAAHTRRHIVQAMMAMGTGYDIDLSENIVN